MLHWHVIYGQRHAKRVDPDQPPRLRHSVWSGSAHFDTRNINGTYFSTLCEMSDGPFSRDAGHMYKNLSFDLLIKLLLLWPLVCFINPQSKIGGHIKFVLSVCHFACLIVCLSVCVSICCTHA